MGARRAIAGLAALGLLAGAAPAHATERAAYAAALDYATPSVVMGKGDALRFTNLDSLAQHDLRSDQPGKFSTPLIGNGSSVLVAGADKLPEGNYAFHCSIHAWMHGQLTVAAAGGVPSGGGAPAPPPSGGGSGANPVDLLPRAKAEPIGNASWPLYGRDLANSRNGGSDGPSYNEVLTLGPVWSFQSGAGDFTGTPVVARNTIVAGASKGTVFGVNATTGKLRWKRDLKAPINGSAAIAGNRVFVPVAKAGAPRVAALSLASGRVLWSRRIDNQPEGDVFGSPVVWRGTVYIGTSGYFGEVNDPKTHVRGSVVALSARNGKVRWKTYTVPRKHDGGAVWSTPAVDGRRGRLYVGTGNAYHPPAAATTDALLALSTRTGRILRHFQVQKDDSWTEAQGATGGPDADMGASPNLMLGPGNRRLVGAGSKSGVYWGFDRTTLRPVWNTMTGPSAGFTGGIVGSTAFDEEGIYGPDTPGGVIWSLAHGGAMRWTSADGDPLHFSSTSVANGIVYTTDLSGHLNARDAGTGVVLAKLPLGAPSWGGVAIAGRSVFAVTGTQGTTGYLVSYRPRG